MPHPTHGDPNGDPASAPLIVFDFDGTVCLGDAPAFAYARAIQDVSGAAGIVDALRIFLEDPRADARYAACDDPYDVVSIAARAQGVGEAHRSTAYLQSRAAAATLEVHAPEGLHDFLDGLRSTLVLVTNAPAPGLEALLGKLGLVGRFSQIVTSADKPAGMARYVAPHLAAQRPVMSIGDKWENDLAPVAALGGSTALIDSYGIATPRPADHAARTLPELYPALQAWDSRHQAPARTTTA